jgi:DNA polymerase
MGPFDTLDELRAEASSCTACGLSQRRTNVVFGEGNPHSPLVLVGEGPGDTEDKTGRPFVGQAGQVLDRALLDNGLDRTDVYICNIVKCRACDWKNDTAFNRPPTPEEVGTCSQWLMPQLRLIAPKVILCIGSPSANTLIKRGIQITKERGVFFDSQLAPKIIATLHPAYILRQRGARSDGGYSLLVQDIGEAWMAAALA